MKYINSEANGDFLLKLYFFLRSQLHSHVTVFKSVCGWGREVTLLAESQILRVLKPKDNMLNGSLMLSMRKGLL